MIADRKAIRKYELHEFTDAYGQARFYKIRVKDGWFWKWVTKNDPFSTTAVPDSEFTFDTYDHLAHEFRDPEVAMRIQEIPARYAMGQSRSRGNLNLLS